MPSRAGSAAEESDRLRSRKMSEAMFVVLGGIRPFLDHVVRHHLHTRVVVDVTATLGSSEQCRCGNRNFLDADEKKNQGIITNPAPLCSIYTTRRCAVPVSTLFVLTTPGSILLRACGGPM
jgi:hypothetical protein